MLHAAVVGLQAGVAQAAGAVGQLTRQRHGGVAGRHAAAALANVDLDVDVDHRARQPHGLGQALDAFAAVDRDGQLAAARGQLVRQRGHAAQLADGQQLVGDEDVVDAAGGQRLGLAHRLHAQADGAGLQLQVGELGALVHLGVRAQAQAVAAGESAHALQVAVGGVQVDHQRRRVDGVHALADQGTQARSDKVS